MERVAVIGTGAIGSAVARRLTENGYEVVVWNRTSARTRMAVEAGAVEAASLDDAVSNAELVLFTLTDHAAVQQCLAGLHVDLTGRTVVTLSTGTADEAREAARVLGKLGADYLDAGVQSSPDMIATGTGSFLYSGSRPGYDRHSRALDLLGRARFVGEPPEAAAVWDLALFGVWYDAHLGLLRAFDTVRQAGIDVAGFGETAADQLGHVVAGVAETATELRTGEFPPGPADLAGHLPVIDHIIALRADNPLADGGLTHVARHIRALITAGHGDKGLTATTTRTDA